MVLYIIVWLNPPFLNSEATSVSSPPLGSCFSSFRAADLHLLLLFFAALSFAVPAAMLLLRADLCILQCFFQLLMLLLGRLPGFSGFVPVLETSGRKGCLEGACKEGTTLW